MTMSWNLQNYETKKKILISQYLGNFVTLIQSWLAELIHESSYFSEFSAFQWGKPWEDLFLCLCITWFSMAVISKNKTKAAYFRRHIQRSVHCIRCDQLFRTIVHIKWIILEFRCYKKTSRWSLQLTVLINKKTETIWFPSRSWVHIFTWWKEFIVVF